MLEYAAALAGLVLVTINPSFQLAEMSYVIGQSKAVALFYVSSCRGNPIGDIARQVQSAEPALQTLVDLQDERAFHGAPDPGGYRFSGAGADGTRPGVGGGYPIPEWTH